MASVSAEWSPDALGLGGCCVKVGGASLIAEDRGLKSPDSGPFIGSGTLATAAPSTYLPISMSAQAFSFTGACSNKESLSKE